ncbi:MAG: type IV pilus twitching motility protein PilT [bacterium JZ-2024 1]
MRKIEIYDLLRLMVERNASDLHLGYDRPPYLRIDGVLEPTDLPILTDEVLEEYARVLLTPKREHLLDERDEMDFSFRAPGIEGRFRVNFFRQRGSISLAIRYVKTRIPEFEEINLPPLFGKLALKQRGLIIVTGTTGSGKSTTLACMIEHINRNLPVHILTVEDPIEYVFTDKKAIINQREVGLDTSSFAAALRTAMREDPDVIMIGEMRDADSIMAAITAAITGHLVLTTLHTMDVVQTLNRIIEYFPPDFQQQVRIMLGTTLEAVISQRLMPMLGGGRIPALEILVATARVRELIQEGEDLSLIRQAMEEDEYEGMQTFDQHLYQLYTSGKITFDTALAFTTSPHDFKLFVRQKTLARAKSQFTSGIISTGSETSL